MKKNKLDGLPGLVIHGLNGSDGARGFMTFCNNDTELNISKFSNKNNIGNIKKIGLGIEYNTETESYSPIVFSLTEQKNNIINLLPDIINPDINDYLLNITPTYTNLYRITDKLGITTKSYNYIKNLRTALSTGDSEQIQNIKTNENFIRDIHLGTESNNEIIIDAFEFLSGLYNNDINGNTKQKINNSIENILTAYVKSVLGTEESDEEIEETNDNIELDSEESEIIEEDDTEILFSIYALDKLDTWNFTTGIPNIQDILVNIKGTRIYRSIWQGAYEPNTIKKKAVMTAYDNKFKHFHNNSLIETSDMYTYCMDILGYSANTNGELSFISNNIEDENNTAMLPVKIDPYEIIFDDTVVNGYSIPINFKLSFINPINGIPYANKDLNIDFYFGKHHFYAGNPATTINNNTFILQGANNRYTVTLLKYNSTVGEEYANKTFISSITNYKVRTDNNGEAIISFSFQKTAFNNSNHPAINVSELQFAYVTVRSDETDFNKQDIFSSTHLINKITCLLNNDTPTVICKLLPKDFNDISLYPEIEQYNVELHPDFNYYKDNSISSTNSVFSVDIDEFPYIDTLKPVLRQPIMTKETFYNDEISTKPTNEFVEKEDIKLYYDDETFCPENNKEFVFIQFYINTGLSPEEFKKIRIEVEFTSRETNFTESVSTCMDEKWSLNKYEVNETDDNNDNVETINLQENIGERQHKLMEDAYNNPENYTEDTFSELLTNYNVRDIYYNSNEDEQVLYAKGGFSKNYNYTLNFDRENILPCSICVKDFFETISGTQYISTVIIPYVAIENADIQVYAYYKKTSSSCSKIYLGNASISQIF